MATSQTMDFVDTSQNNFEMNNCSSLEQSSSVSIKKTPPYSVSSFSQFDNHFCSNSDAETIASFRLHSSKDDLTEEEVLDDDEDCILSTGFDSAIDLSVASLDRASSVSSRKHSTGECRCKCLRDRTSKRVTKASLLSCPKQKPLQVSISFPIYADGSYADPRNLTGRSTWFVDTQPPQPSRYEPGGSANTNSNNNRGPQIITTSNSNPSTIDTSHQKTERPFQFARKTYSKKSSLMSRNKWLCVLILVLAFVTLATIGALVYFVIHSKHSQGENDALNPDSPSNNSSIIPAANMSLNQSCGTIPSRYLPEGVVYQLPFIPNPSQSNVLPPINDSRTTIKQRILEGESTNIANYPWQKSGWSITARLWADNFHKNDDLPIMSPTLHRQGRIIGGEATSIRQFPWQGALFIQGRGFVCSASIILRKWIISAVHCMEIEVDLTKWVAHFGVTALTHRHEGELRNIINVISNQNYFKGDIAYDYDISLLELDRVLPYTKFIQPICVPPPDFLFPDGMECYISGWGLTNPDGQLPHADVLQHAQVDVIGNETCNQPDWLDNLVTERMLCAGKPEGGKDSCQGDSGGPLSCYIAEKEMWMVAGIVSWGIGCGLPKFPGVYTKISFFTEWIWKKIAQSEGILPLDPVEPLDPSEGSASGEMYENLFDENTTYYNPPQGVFN